VFEAAIFDMDGLLIDSEPFWRDAEKEVFGSVGIDVTEEVASQTSRMTTKEATDYWYSLQPWRHKSLEEIEQAVITKVGQLIDANGTIMPGVEKTIRFLKQKGYKLGLATNSPDFLVSKVLRKLCIEHYFDATSSSEFEANGKPSPDVYLTTARKLGVAPANCIAFEDSKSGVQAAIAAGMKVIVVPDKVQFYDSGFEIADMKISCLEQFCDEHIQILREV
jgi:HAD superfamily hydrolase (TIGR01509 family)